MDAESESTPEILVPASTPSMGHRMGAGRQENNNWHSVQIWKLYLLHLIHKLPNTALLYIPLALFRLIHLDGLSIYTEFGFSCFFFSHLIQIYEVVTVLALSGDPAVNKTDPKSSQSCGERQTRHTCHISTGQPWQCPVRKSFAPSVLHSFTRIPVHLEPNSFCLKKKMIGVVPILGI